MRSFATLMGILALFLSSCSIEPHVRESSDHALDKLKGPEPGSIDSELSNQAQQAMAQGDFKQAAQIYKQLVDKSPDNMAYQLGFAESLRRIGNFGLSLKVTDGILAKEPGNAGALENKGLCLMSTGEFAEAGTAFGDVMKTDRGRWRTLNGIGILFAMKGKYDNAVAYYQAALNISTDNPSVLNNAALTYAIDQQFDRAYDAFARARRHVSPGSADMKHLDLNLALVYAVNGKLDLAEQTATPYLSKEGLYNNMGFYSYLAKNNELAKGYLNMALTQSPTYYERAWKNLGALTGDSAAGQGQAMPAEATPRDSGISASLPTPTQAASPSPAAQPAGVALDDIPESKSQRISSIPALGAGEQKPDTDKQKAADDAGAAAKTGAPDINPDVVLLHKSVPEHNGDWDAPPKKPDASGGDAVPAAASGSGN
jgi:Flp pilus assembly protein TadD